MNVHFKFSEGCFNKLGSVSATKAFHQHEFVKLDACHHDHGGCVDDDGLLVFDSQIADLQQVVASHTKKCFSIEFDEADLAGSAFRTQFRGAFQAFQSNDFAVCEVELTEVDEDLVSTQMTNLILTVMVKFTYVQNHVHLDVASRLPSKTCSCGCCCNCHGRASCAPDDWSVDQLWWGLMWLRQ